MEDQQTFGFLLTYLMESLEVDPGRIFEIDDLKSRAESEVQPLIDAGYLITCGETDGVASRFRASVEPMIKGIRTSQHLKGAGTPKRLDPRLIYLGTGTLKAQVYSWFFALVTDRKQLRDLMTGKAQSHLVGERIVIVTPTFADPAAVDRLGIPYSVELLTLGALELVKVRSEEARKRLLSRSLRGRSSAVEREIKALNLWVCKTISITGLTERKDLNMFYVGTTKVLMGDRHFILFLTLMLQQFLDPFGGRIHVDELVKRQLLNEHKKEDAISRFRNHLRGAGYDTKKVIERDREGEIRLSAHKSFFRVDTARLMKHPNPDVGKLAAALKEKGVREPEKADV